VVDEKYLLTAVYFSRIYPGVYQYTHF